MASTVLQMATVVKLPSKLESQDDLSTNPNPVRSQPQPQPHGHLCFHLYPLKISFACFQVSYKKNPKNYSSLSGISNHCPGFLTAELNDYYSSDRVYFSHWIDWSQRTHMSFPIVLCVMKITSVLHIIEWCVLIIKLLCNLLELTLHF